MAALTTPRAARPFGRQPPALLTGRLPAFQQVLQYLGILRVPDSAAITPLARTQQRLPMVSLQPLKRLCAGAAFHQSMVPTTTGEPFNGREWRLNLQS